MLLGTYAFLMRNGSGHSIKLSFGLTCTRQVVMIYAIKIIFFTSDRFYLTGKLKVALLAIFLLQVALYIVNFIYNTEEEYWSPFII